MEGLHIDKKKRGAKIKGQKRKKEQSKNHGKSIGENSGEK